MTTRLVVAVCLLFFSSRLACAQNFHAFLNGAQERPNPVVSNGTGNGTASFDPSTNMLSVHLDFQGLGSNAQDAHIHCCAPPTTSTSVAVGFTNPALNFPFGGTSGVFNHTFNLLDASIYTAGFLNGPGGGTAAGARTALINAFQIGNAYFNVHTVNNPPGEIRGNIFPVPEPTSLLLLLCGLAWSTGWRRFRT